ncbi:MAG TPA: AtaL-like protein [Steroidobacteraceae bacterium]|nr:AtaL-like protein [Steroidobacteraceae bacterium]
MTQPLHHEHIVRINDPANVAGAWLTREQLWAGLQHTVIAPELIDQSIDSVSIEEIGPSRLRREIHRGHRATTDEVQLVPHESLRISADAAGEFAGSTLEIRIEEPAPEMLFVRFTYDVRGLADSRDEDEDRARRSAYQSSDIERICEARRYASRRAHLTQ